MIMNRAFQSLWFTHEYNFEWKEHVSLKSAHDYSYENDSYSFKV
jgi:hypothetical protein